VTARRAIAWLGNGISCGSKYSPDRITSLGLALIYDSLNSDTVLGMVGLVMVDGEAWAWMGWPRAADGVAMLQGAEQTAFEYTSTKSIFTFDVGGKINLTATFLSPLTPHDLRRQSLVMSYLHVEVASSDGKAHNVSVYTDISAGKRQFVFF
jgi:hypothetical protein